VELRTRATLGALRVLSTSWEIATGERVGVSKGSVIGSGEESPEDLHAPRAEAGKRTSERQARSSLERRDDLAPTDDQGREMNSGTFRKKCAGRDAAVRRFSTR
jgi:hypothetical protein